MKKFLLLILFIQTGVISCLKAQVDPHFSQIYAYPLWLNPALTGVFDGDTRVTANFKDQWTGITNGYQTTAISADYKATDKVSVGINLLDQKDGSADYNYLAAYGTLGYMVPISQDGTKKLHFGLQVGFIDRSFNAGDLEFGDQYNPLIGYDPNLASGENFSATSSFIFDSGLGIYYDEANSGSTLRPFGGVSIYHVNGAQDPFAEPGTDFKIPIRLNVHGGIKVEVTDDFELTPSLLYIREQKNQIRAVDLYAELKANEGNSFILGTQYQYDNAVIAEFGYRFNKATLGISYDIDTSPLNELTNGRGGLELSLNYIFGNSGATSDSSPKF